MIIRGLTLLVQALHLRDDGGELVGVLLRHVILLLCTANTRTQKQLRIAPRPDPRNGTAQKEPGQEGRTVDEALHGEVLGPEHPALRQPLLLLPPAAAAALCPGPLRRRRHGETELTLGPKSIPTLASAARLRATGEGKGSAGGGMKNFAENLETGRE